MKPRFPAASGKRVLNHGWTQMDTDLKRLNRFTFRASVNLMPGLSVFLSMSIFVHPWLNSGFQNKATFPQTRFSKKGST